LRATAAAAGFPREGIIGGCKETDPLTSTLWLRRALCAATVLVPLAGCELFKGNEEVTTVINRRAIGMSGGDFFDRYGRPGFKRDLGDGSAEYEWASSLPFAQPGPVGQDDRICRLRITVDVKGRVSAVQVVYDGLGLKSTTRCGEIFSAP
jgi:hypothetical protein